MQINICIKFVEIVDFIFCKKQHTHHLDELQKLLYNAQSEVSNYSFFMIRKIIINYAEAEFIRHITIFQL